jgi:hypothetical protein
VSWLRVQWSYGKKTVQKILMLVALEADLDEIVGASDCRTKHQQQDFCQRIQHLRRLTRSRSAEKCDQKQGGAGWDVETSG